MKMNEKRTGLFENGLIWFGAGVSIAEILTGTYLAPLGMGKGLAAILIGHIIGCLMLFLAGVIGGRVRKSAMETVKMSFGQKGSILFAVLNVLQLVGWTAIMIYDGALAADGVMHTGRWIWCLVIGVLIILWIVIGITNLGKINTVAMAALFLLSLILSKVIFAGGGAGAPSDDSMTFGAAVELAVAMPLSWLPLISDYTREAKAHEARQLLARIVRQIFPAHHNLPRQRRQKSGQRAQQCGLAATVGTDQTGQLTGIKGSGEVCPHDVGLVFGTVTGGQSVYGECGRLGVHRQYTSFCLCGIKKTMDFRKTLF